MAIYRGQLVRIDGQFDRPGDDGAPAPYDPSPAPTLTLRHPATGDVIEATVTRAEVGVYYADVVPMHSGRWAYRWHVGGAQPAAQEGGFSVEMSSFPE